MYNIRKYFIYFAIKILFNLILEKLSLLLIKLRNIALFILPLTSFQVL